MQASEIVLFEFLRDCLDAVDFFVVTGVTAGGGGGVVDLNACAGPGWGACGCFPCHCARCAIVTAGC